MRRISVCKDDAGYRTFNCAKANGKAVHVFLDGQEVMQCMTADEDQGFVVRAVLDARGRVQIDPVDSNKIWYETVKGRVRVEFKDEHDWQSDCRASS